MSRSIEIEIARQARQLLSDESRFSSYAEARTRDQRPCNPLSSNAARWCARGALVKAAFDLTGDAGRGRELARACERAIFRTVAPRFNDRRGRQAVVDKLTAFLDGQASR